MSDTMQAAIRDCFISPNVADANGEAANVVDALDDIARAIFYLAKCIKESNETTAVDSKPAKKATAPPKDISKMPDDALLRQSDLIPILPFSAATLWRKVRSGDFPKPIRMGSGHGRFGHQATITGWRVKEVNDWFANQT